MYAGVESDDEDEGVQLLACNKRPVSRVGTLGPLAGYWLMPLAGSRGLTGRFFGPKNEKIKMRAP